MSSQRELVSVVVTGVAGQPVFGVAERICRAMNDAGRYASCSGSPDARAGQGIEAHVVVANESPAPWPLVAQGGCHLVVGLEPTEALRSAALYATAGMVGVSHKHPMIPHTVLHEASEYPDLDDCATSLNEVGIDFRWLPGPDAGAAVSAIESALTAEALAVLSTMSEIDAFDVSLSSTRGVTPSSTTQDSTNNEMEKS